MSSWSLFGSSETTKLVESITNVFKDNHLLIFHLLKEDILDPDGKNKLNETLKTTVSNFLYYHPKLKETEQAMLKHIETVKKQIKHTETMSQLAEKITGLIKDDWLLALLQPGLLHHDKQQKLIKLLETTTLTFLSQLSADGLRNLMLNAGDHQQKMDRDKLKSEEMTHINKQGNVKKTVGLLEKVFSNDKPIANKPAIQVRPLVISDEFTKKMGQICHAHIEQLKVPDDAKIIVKEYYSNGRIRLLGLRLDTRRIGTWKWFKPSGETYATWIYDDSNTWSYLDTNGLYTGQKLKGDGDGTLQDTKGFAVWFHEAMIFANW